MNEEYELRLEEAERDVFLYCCNNPIKYRYRSLEYKSLVEDVANDYDVCYIDLLNRIEDNLND